MSTLKRPPSPKALPILGVLPKLQSDPLKHLAEWAKLGDIVELPVPTTKLYLITNPTLAQQVLATTESKFHKGISERPQLLQKQILGEGLIAIQGEEWLWTRRGVFPPFHRRYIATYAPLIVEHATRTLDSWKDGDVREIHHDMTQLTLRIICDAFFGFEPPAEIEMIGGFIDLLVTEYAKRTLNPLHLPLGFPTLTNIKIRRAIRWLQNIVSKIIQQRRNSRNDKDDLLSVLLSLKDKDGNSLPDETIRAHVMTFFLAGYETTSIALSYTFTLLSQHPEVEERLVSEIQGVLQGRRPMAEDVQNLRYTQMILKEAMRLYPPAWIVSARIPLNDCELGGYTISKGSLLLISQWTIHRDERYYDEPERFYPERWEADLSGRDSVYPYFPFGAGPRICIGKDFALMEAALLLATIVQRFRLTLVANHPIVPSPLATLRPKYGVKMTIGLRSEAEINHAKGEDKTRIGGHVAESSKPEEYVRQCPYHAR